MNSRRLIATLLAFMLVVSAGGVAIAGQSSTPTYMDRMLGIDENPEIDRLTKLVEGAKGEMAAEFGQIQLEVTRSSDAEASLRRVQAFFNKRSEIFLAMANQRVNATGEHNVVQITFRYEGETETKYLIADVEDGNYTSAHIYNSPTGDVVRYVKTDTGYTVHLESGDIKHRDQLKPEIDDTLVLESLAVANAPKELQYFYQTVVKPQNAASKPYIVRTAAKYNGAVNTTLVGGDEL